MTTYILHHSPCQDGSAAKYAAFKKFEDEAVYIPVNYGKPFPSQIPLDRTSEIYIVDFSYPRAILEDVYGKVGKLVVLDHHKTAQADLEGLDFAHFDMEKSGAVLAWEYFHPGTPVPRLLLRVQDRDIWKWNYSDTASTLARLTVAGEKFSIWDELEANFELTQQEGKAIAEYQANCVERKVADEGDWFFAQWGVEAAIVYNSTHLISETANALLEIHHPDSASIAIGFYFDKTGTPFLSMRSRPDGPDVSAICKKLGGGGHEHAAGAKIDIQLLACITEKFHVFPSDIYNFLERKKAQDAINATVAAFSKQ